jgi:hypothetical protein
VVLDESTFTQVYLALNLLFSCLSVSQFVEIRFICAYIYVCIDVCFHPNDMNMYVYTCM